MTSTRVLLTGATGFIGSKVLRRLLEARDAHDLTVVTAGRAQAAPGVPWREADLAVPASLHGIASDAHVLLHLASRVSGGEAECEAVNVRGTGALMAEATKAGVGRVVHLSTSAVYGAGPHRGIAVDEIEPRPVSPASRTRLEGERSALAAGGTVLRPGLVTGAGDRWVVPAMAELVRRVPFRWDGGRGLASMVDADDLARLITSLALTGEPAPGGIHHASHPVPVRIGDLLTRLSELDILPAVTEDLSWPECLLQLRRTSGKVSERQFSLLAGDHRYRSDTVWDAAECTPGPGPLARLAEAAPWYREHLGRDADAPTTA